MVNGIDCSGVLLETWSVLQVSDSGVLLQTNLCFVEGKLAFCYKKLDILESYNLLVRLR